MRIPVLAVLTVALLAFNMRTAIAGIPPVLPDLGLSPAGQSVLATVPVLCFSLAALAAPGLRARAGEERVLIGALAVLLVGVLVRAAWPTVHAWLFLGTVLVGCAIALMNVLVTSLVRRRFPGRAGPMTAVYTTALVIGGASAAGLTVPLRDAADGSLHVALGIWAIPVAIALVVWLPERRHRAQPRPVTSGRDAIRALRSDPVAWSVTMFMGLQSLVFYGSLSWLPAIHRDQGIDPTHAGLLLSSMSLVSIAGTFLAPVIAHRMPDQRLAALGATLLTVAGLAGILLAPSSVALVWVMLLGIGQGAALSLSLLMMVVRAGDDDTSARLSSMAQSIGYLLAAAGPLLLGLLHATTGGWDLPLLTLIGVGVLEGVFGWSAGRDRTVSVSA